MTDANEHLAPPPASVLVVRPATRADLPEVLRLLRDDVLRREPDGDVGPQHLAAFDAIEADPDDLLVVGELDGRVVATAQLTLLHGLSRGARPRLQVEAVRVDSTLRGAGLGARLMAWVEQHARDRGAGLVQLTSDRSRTGAHRFYERLGYAPSHLGFKLLLD
ncbi:GNAT family N-acetyltransferase [Angustibacter aerolatus]